MVFRGFGEEVCLEGFGGKRWEVSSLPGGLPSGAVSSCSVKEGEPAKA